MRMLPRISKICLPCFLLAVFVLPIIFCFAQVSPAEERKMLEEELQKLEEQISQYEEDITKTQQEKKTLQNQISILKKKIQKLELQVQQSNVMIKDLSLQIKDTEGSIEKTSLNIEDSKEKLSNILRTIYEENQKSLIEILFSEPELSDFFDNLTSLESLNAKNQELLDNIKNLKTYLESQKESLDEEKGDLEKVLEMQVLQKKDNEDTKKEQEWLLGKTKGKESEYQKLLTETQKKAQDIRARIFELIGVPKAPTFGEAYEIAKYVETLTGVRPAFLLAILTQESNIGMNVGQCYLANTQTGEGVRIKTGKIAPKTMSPTRDVPYFLSITQELGRDPFNTPVSCPMEYGWGGAMGPAQFIPSTWMKYRDKVSQITGKPADPWDIKDSFLASALYLANCGADAKTRDAEWRAALIYFSGSVNRAYRFYGDSVLSIASQYEDDIAAIESGNLTQR